MTVLNNRSKVAFASLLLSSLAAMGGCGAANTTTAKAHVQPNGAQARGSCTARGRASVTPIGDAHTGSTLALASWAGRRIAFVADALERSVQVIDVDAGKRLSALHLDGRPSQLMLLPGGRLVVENRDRSRLEILFPGTRPSDPLTRGCTVPTPAEPVALATTPDSHTLLVTSGWGHALSAYSTRDLAASFRVDLPREPRAVVVADGGRTAIVSHAVGGEASAVDLQGPDHGVSEIALRGLEPMQVRRMRELVGSSRAAMLSGLAGFGDRRHSCQGYALARSVEPAGRVLAPQVLVDPGNTKARPSGYGNDDSPTEAPSIAVIDPGSKSALPISLEVVDTTRFVRSSDPPPPPCLLPRAAAVEPGTNTLLVACLGIDSLIAYDAAAASPARAEMRRWKLPSGPDGIAIDAKRRQALVWSEFERTVSVVPLDHTGPVDDKTHPVKIARVALPADPSREPSLELRLGRELFYASNDRRISKDGRACASCHPDGRDDSLTWATPNGPRRSIMLAGRLAGTAPYSWQGGERDLRVHLTRTFKRLHGTGGLRSVELRALIAYIRSIAPPPRVQHDDPRIARGARLFASTATGCSDCHSGPELTDDDTHNVSSRTPADRTGRFNTPSLRFISGKAPYFHDGRFKTLRQLLAATDGKMGHTSQLSPSDRDALLAYLESL